MTSTLLYYISRSFGYRNIDDRHRNPNINIKEIIWLGNRLQDVVLTTTMMMKTVVKNLMLNTKEEAAEAENSKCLHSPGG